MNERERVKIETLQGYTEKRHLEYIRRILRFPFWCVEERLFFIQMYNGLIIEKMEWDNQPIYAENLDRFFEVINF
jgi:hypothetical protein